MTDFQITAAQIAAATDGGVDQKALVNWNERGHWLTAVEPHRRGKPRHYSYENALEASLAGAMTSLGMSREQAKLVLMRRVSDSRAAKSGWSEIKAGELEALPELHWPIAWWSIVVTQGTLAVSAVKSLSEIDPEMQQAVGFRATPISAIKAQLDSVLSDDAIQSSAA